MIRSTSKAGILSQEELWVVDSNLQFSVYIVLGILNPWLVYVARLQHLVSRMDVYSNILCSDFRAFLCRRHHLFYMMILTLIMGQLCLCPHFALQHQVCPPFLQLCMIAVSLNGVNL
jgi:hypothetical protein